jgi:hypothetical protein
MTVILSDFGAPYSGSGLAYRSCLHLLLSLLEQSILLPDLSLKLLADRLDPHDCRLLRFHALLKLLVLEF